MFFRFPAYMYIDGKTENIPITMMFHEDDELVYKYNTTDPAYLEENIIGMSLYDLPEKLTEIVGFPICNNLMQMVNYYNGETTVRPLEIYEKTILNALGMSLRNEAIMGIESGTTFPHIINRLTTLNSDLHISWGGSRPAIFSRSLSSFQDYWIIYGNYNYSRDTQSPKTFIRLEKQGSAMAKPILYIEYNLYPENLFVETGVREFEENHKPVTLQIDVEFNPATYGPTLIRVRGNAPGQTPGIPWSDALCNNFRNMYSDFKSGNSGGSDMDSDNPYGVGGQSSVGGGDGKYGSIDDVDGADIPSLPDTSATDLGFITMYNPTAAQLKNLSSFMWSGVFDLDTYKKLFSDPMESIIGLAIVPVSPNVSGNKNVMFGSIDSGVSMPVISSQYVQLNCGSVSIEKYVGSFLDYSPYTKISLYLPYIGIHDLSPDDIMDDTIQVVYNIDVLSGACGAFVKSAKKGVLYSYNGSCISNIPLTSINFSSAIQNAVSAVCSGAGIIAGVATGAAPITAMGAIGLANSAANTALNSKPTVQRSGSLGGSAGIMSIQKPYIIIERPAVSVPSFINRYVGNTSNITMSLNDCHGFTMVEFVHLHDIPATDEEIQEIEALLKEGVIL